MRIGSDSLELNARREYAVLFFWFNHVTARVSRHKITRYNAERTEVQDRGNIASRRDISSTVLWTRWFGSPARTMHFDTPAASAAGFIHRM